MRRTKSIVVDDALIKRLHLRSSPEAEQALVDAAAVSRAKYEEAALIISAEDFFTPPCRLLWGMLAEEYAANPSAQDVSMELMRRLLNENKQLFDTYMEITNYVHRNPELFHGVTKAALLVKECSIARRMMAGLLETFGRCSDGKFDPLEEIPLITERMNALIPSITLGFKDPAEIIRENFNFSMLTEAEKAHSTVPTYIAALDELMHGFPRKKFMIIGARPSIGKTSLAVGCALNQLQGGRKVGFFSIEMPREEIMQKMASIMSGVPMYALQHFELTEGQREAYFNASAALSTIARKDNFFLDDAGRLTAARARALMRRMKDAGAEVIYIDYLQLMETSAAYKDQNGAGRYGDISRELKSLAKELDVCVVALAQLTREVKDGSDPHLAHLKESGSFEQDADVVAFINRPEVYGVKTIEIPGRPPVSSAGLGKILVRKYRGGPTGEVIVKFSNGHFENATHADLSETNEPKPSKRTQKETFFG